MMDKDTILKETEEILPYAIDVRHHLHRIPELSFQEYQTSQFLKEELDRFKIPWQSVGETGIVAVIQGKDPEGENCRTLALRTDMDALPLQEMSEVSYTSCNANMHACGHDLHMAILLATAILLKKYENHLDGTVKLLFQPAEEIGAGAQEMIKSGLLKGVDTIIALHMDPQEKTGIFRTGPGVRTSFGCCLEITIHGTQRDVFPAVARLTGLVNDRLPVYMQTKYPFACSPTIVNTDTQGENTQVKIFYDGRVFTQEDSMQMENGVRKLAESIEEIYSVETKVYAKRIGGAVENDLKSTQMAVEVIETLFGKKAVYLSEPAMFGEDFRCYRQITKKLVFTMLGGAEGEETWPLHNSKVRFADEALRYGIAYYLGFTENYFKGVISCKSSTTSS